MQPLGHVVENSSMFWPECGIVPPFEPHNDHDTDTFAVFSVGREESPVLFVAMLPY